jgi:hypothetical protein
MKRRSAGSSSPKSIFRGSSTIYESSNLSAGAQSAIGLALFSLSILGCSESSSNAGGEGENLGYELVQQVVDPTRTLGLEEVFRVGNYDGAVESQIYNAWAATVSPSGDLYVMDTGNDRVAVFDSNGEFSHQFGREGEGPGEFKRAMHLWIQGDTLVVMDRSARRTHAFRLDGSHIATLTLRPPEPKTENGPGKPVSYGSDWFLPMDGYFIDSYNSVDPPLPRMRLYHFDPMTEGIMDPTGYYWEWPAPGEWSGIYWLEPIFMHQPAWAMDGLGRVHLADSGDYTIETFGVDGTLLRRMENTTERVPVTRQDIDVWKANQECTAEKGPNCSQDRNDKILALPRPELRPVVSRIRAFPSGHMAVVRGDLDPNPFESGDVSVYDYFDPDGRYLGRLDTPVTPYWFDGETLVSHERDELGVEYMVLYRVHVKGQH